MSDQSTALFSHGYEPDDPAKCSPEIVEAFAELTSVVGEVRCVRWNVDYIAAAFNLPVDLPSRGPVNGLDIRASEPLMLVFHKRDYPERAPMVRSDRKDFPVAFLPHLNPVGRNEPASLCLHRGNFNDWFAEHSIAELITRIRGWLRDAARNRLIRSTDLFEPTRVIDAVGTAVFPPSDFQTWLNSGWKSCSGQPGYGFLAFSLMEREHYNEIRDGAFPVRAQYFYPKEADLSKPLEAAIAIEKIASDQKSVAPSCFGILAWTKKQQPIHEYFGSLPRTARELVEFCAHLGIPLPEALGDYLAKGLAVLKPIPIIIGIVRPQLILNTTLDVEPLCFVVDASSEEFQKTAVFPEGALCYSLAHRSPLTPEAAREISGISEQDNVGRILLLGAGALGSKIGLHFGRSGHTAMTPVDNDILSPHNFVRHALLPDQTGLNKAKALTSSIYSIFENIAKESAPLYDNISAFEWLKGNRRADLNHHNLLLDATASGMVFEALTKSDLPPHLKVARASIADLGNIGALMLEGAGRNPRIDDLNVLMIDLAIDEPTLAKWLQRDRDQRQERVGPMLEEITIGMTCASDTMRLPDDIVSWHASTFAITLRELCRTPQKGFLVINHRRASNDAELGGLLSERIEAKPVIVLPSLCVKGWQVRDRSAWQIRIVAHVVAEMKRRLNESGPAETGGLMIGLIHPRRRIIYVTRLLSAPPDSEGSAAWFKRGTFKLPEKVNAINQASSGLLGYVGDWHTHPRGSGRISPTDVQAMIKTKRDFDTAGLPTFILIVSHRGLNPYVIDAR
jgi:hypothetical protein